MEAMKGKILAEDKLDAIYTQNPATGAVVPNAGTKIPADFFCAGVTGAAANSVRPKSRRQA
jgi:hypothetical protein